MEPIPVLYLRHAAGGGGGADTVIINTVPLMNRARFPVTLAYLRKPSENLGAIYKTLAERGIPHLDFPGTGLLDPSQFTRIAKVVREGGVRIVHCHDPKSDVYGYLLRWLFPRVKFIGTMHGWTVARKRSRLYVAIDRWVLRSFDAVIAVSDAILQTAARHGIKNTHLNKNSIDVDKWRPAGGGRAKVNADIGKIGFAGRLSKEKGPLDFVLVAQKVLARNPGAEFHVAGIGPEEETMRTLVRRLGVEKSFHFAGHLDEHRLRLFYRDLDVLLLTSYSEGIPLTVLEALAMEIPVVATRVGGVGEVIESGNNGLLASAGDVETLAGHVEWILRDRERASGLGAAGRMVVERDFSLAASAKKIEAVYEQAIISS